jgi:DNA-binding transcriptional LysR family regulator
MHIETLKTFCDLVETGSFNKTAQLNLVSQSAVSQQLKALESRYGQALLERGARRGLKLTDAGRVFYAECREIVGRLRQLEERLHERAGTVSGTVRLATVYSIGLHELPPYMTRFMKAHPQVKVHVEYSRTDKVCEGCLQDAIDFGIVAFPLQRANLAVIPWHTEKLLLVCAPNHRLARRRKVGIAELSGERFIAFERDIPTRKTIDRILKAHGVQVDVAMAFDNVETIKRSVEVGSGVSILPVSTVGNERKGGLLVTRDFVEGPFTREVGVIHRRGRVLGAAAQAFVHLLVGDRPPRAAMETGLSRSRETSQPRQTPRRS